MRQKSNGTHLILMELMMVLFFFAICGSILLQVFVKAHNISAKAREMTMWRENQQIYQLDILRYRQERKDNERS